MENNQEHKLDKIFRETFENKEITPPSDAWMGIHTYTIGQEEKKPKIWLKYALLAMLLLLISGFGVWYFVDNQRYTSKLLTEKVVSDDNINQNRRSESTALDNAGRVLNPASVRNAETLASYPLLRKQTLPNNISSHYKRMLTLITPQVDWSGDLPRDEDSSSNQNIKLIEPVTYLTDNKVEIIEPKQLILNDLINKIQKENENKVVALEEDVIDNKEISKVDSVDYGGKFSLRHPIINFGGGYMWNYWQFSGEHFLDNPVAFNPNNRSVTFKLGIAWKINKRFRVGGNIETTGYELGTPFDSQIPSKTLNVGKPLFTLIQVNSDSYYQAKLPFGNVNVPISYFPYKIPNTLNTLDTNRYATYFQNHTMRTFSFTFNSQFDVISKQKGKAKKYEYQLYLLTDLGIQRQIKYNYSATILTNKQPLKNVAYDTGNLNNASNFTLNIRGGLGFRWQFANKLDFYIESSVHHALTNWVKIDNLKTRQISLSLQAGINLNL